MTTDTVQAHLGRMIDLLEDPKRWTQGKYARNKRGREVESKSRAAACFCSVGACFRVEKDMQVRLDTHLLIGEVAGSMMGDGSGVIALNDNTDHPTVMEMLLTAYEHAKGAGV